MARSTASRLLICFAALLTSASFVAAALESSGDGFASVPDHQPSLSQVENFGQTLGIANGGQVRPLLPLGLDLIKDFEQWRPNAYNDAAQYCTIGYGHLIALRACETIQPPNFKTPISELEGAQLLDRDTQFARSAVEDLVTVDLTQEQFGALASFVFNVGARRFSRSTLLRLVNVGDFESASLEFGRWVKAGGRVQRGLVNRRSCEQALFEGSLRYNQNGVFDRKVCISAGAAATTEDLIDIGVGEGAH